MEADEKACPRCAETIKAQAVACRFCGLEMGVVPPVMRAVPQPDTKRLRDSLSLGGLAGAVLAIALIAQCSPKTSSVGAAASSTDAAAAPEAVATPQLPPVTVTAMELWRAYDRNEAAAQAKYGNRVLHVTGIVDSIDLDMSDEPIVHLRTGNEFMSARVNLTDASKPRAKDLAKGASLTVTCASVSEVLGSPILRECDIDG